MRESGVDLGTIGLFTLVGTPYTLKFLWAPVVDALDVPVLSRLLGRRRGWLVLSQLLLMAAIVFLAFCNPAVSPLAGGVRRAAGRHRLGDPGHRDRRVPGRKPRAERAGRRHGVLRRGLPHRHGGVGRRRALHRRGLRAARLRPADGVDASAISAMARSSLVGIVTAICRHRAAAPPRRRALRTPADNPLEARVRTWPIAAFTDFLTRDMAFVDPGLRRPLQVLRRVRRRHDDAVRDRPRLHPHRLRRHREGCSAWRDADRRLCRRLRRARLSAGDLPVDRRVPADGVELRVHLAGLDGHELLGAGRHDHWRRISPARSAR